jgi:hypothetical protein
MEDLVLYSGHPGLEYGSEFDGIYDLTPVNGK